MQPRLIPEMPSYRLIEPLPGLGNDALRLGLNLAQQVCDSDRHRYAPDQGFDDGGAPKGQIRAATSNSVRARSRMRVSSHTGS